MLFSVLTTSVFFWSPYFFSDCVDLKAQPVLESNEDLIIQYDCPDDHYSPLATLFFNTEGAAIRSIISRFCDTGGIIVSWSHMLVYFCAWYFFTITTYGVWTPAGLFLPGIIIGCALGSVYQLAVEAIFDINPDTMTKDELESYYEFATVPVLCAAGAMLSGYTRLTYCLVVIMLETTSSINIFVPMALGILVARAVGGIFTVGLYSRAIRAKQLPVLKEVIPHDNKNIPIYKIM